MFKHSAQLLPIAGLLAIVLLISPTTALAAGLYEDPAASGVQLGDRPLTLIKDLPEGALKAELLQCQFDAAEPQPFSIGHRGAPLAYPEHTLESYRAARSQGAGRLECDVASTRDGKLVCRHAQCDLHTTTNILHTALRGRCQTPPNFNRAQPFADVQCCTSDLTEAEFLSLKGVTKDIAVPSTETRLGDQSASALPEDKTGTLMTHNDSIKLFDAWGVDMVPELKADAEYRDAIVQAYQAAGIDPDRVYLQSFDLDTVRYWIEQYPEFGQQAVYLDGRYRDPAFSPNQSITWRPGMRRLARYGVQYLAPPLWMLVRLDDDNTIVPSRYALAAREAGLRLVPWTLERSGSLKNGGGWYYQSISKVTTRDSVALELLDVLAQDIGVEGVFSDWPATTTMYAHCLINP